LDEFSKLFNIHSLNTKQASEEDAIPRDEIVGSFETMVWDGGDDHSEHKFVSLYKPVVIPVASRLELRPIMRICISFWPKS
jgi:hypothetical protein